MKVAHHAKNFLCLLMFSGTMPTVIASTGRAGSTMLWEAVCNGFIDHWFPQCPRFFRGRLKSIVSLYIARLADINSFHAPVLKTHDRFRPEAAQAAKYVFLFGDPLESAQSVAQMGEEYGLGWIEEHICHLASEGDPRDIFQSDVLNYECQLRSWSAAEGAFLVHYDDLWDRLPELSRYLGFKVVLPERRRRSRKSLPMSYNEALFDRLRRIEQEVRAATLR